MESIGIVGLGIILVLCLICAFKESKVTATYKTFGVYGRWKAYLALDFTGAGAMLAVGPLVDKGNMGLAGYGLAGVFAGIALLAAGILLYYSTWKSCPEFLRSKCIISMIITGLGISMKIAVFFLGFVWKLATPPVITTEDGRTLVVMDGDVYDGSGSKVGYLSPDQTKVIFTSY